MKNDKTTIEVTKGTAAMIRKMHRESFPLMKAAEFMELLALVFKGASDQVRRRLASEVINRKLEQVLDSKKN